MCNCNVCFVEIDVLFIEKLIVKESWLHTITRDKKIDANNKCGCTCMKILTGRRNANARLCNSI